MHHAIRRVVGYEACFAPKCPTTGPKDPETGTTCPATGTKCPATGTGQAKLTEVAVAEPVSGGSFDDLSVENEKSHDLSSLLPRARFFGGTEIRFDSIATSARESGPGQLVALRTGVDDPVVVMAEALARGAAGILTEQILPAPIPQCIVPCVDSALSRLAVAIHGRPDRNLVLIGVIGEAGKTTAAAAIAQVMRDVPCIVATHTDFETCDGVDVQSPATHQAALIEQLRRAAEKGAAVGIIELHETPARSGAYDQLRCDVLVITGRNRAKSGFGPSGLRCVLEQLSKSAIVIVPSDDKSTVALAESCTDAAIVTYGVDDEDADVSISSHRATDGQCWSGQWTGIIRHENRSAIVQSTLAAGTAVEAIAAAAAVGVMTENPLVQIAESLSQIKSLPGRFERIWPSDPADRAAVVLDMAGSPNRVQRTLSWARRMVRLNDSIQTAHRMILPFTPEGAKSRRRQPTRPTGKLWCVLSVDVNEGSEAMLRYGRLLEKASDHLVLTCPPDQKEKFLTTSHSVLDGVQQCAALRLIADERAAIDWAMRHAASCDTIVVISGGSDAPSRSSHADRWRRTIQSAQESTTASDAKAQTLKIVG